jgi:hypothetical protein
VLLRAAVPDRHGTETLLEVVVIHRLHHFDLRVDPMNSGSAMAGS